MCKEEVKDSATCGCIPVEESELESEPVKVLEESKFKYYIVERVEAVLNTKSEAAKYIEAMVEQRRDGMTVVRGRELPVEIKARVTIKT